MSEGNLREKSGMNQHFPPVLCVQLSSAVDGESPISYGVWDNNGGLIVGGRPREQCPPLKERIWISINKLEYFT